MFYTERDSQGNAKGCGKKRIGGGEDYCEGHKISLKCMKHNCMNNIDFTIIQRLYKCNILNK